jgi:hypothetical protein
MSAEELSRVQRFRVEDLPMGGPLQRLAVFREPKPRHNYVVGADFAHGMEQGDADAAQVFDRDTKPWEQVATLHGNWGETKFHKLLYALLRLYNDAFLVGERQVGLTTLRTLVDEYGYTYMYYEKDLGKASKPISDRLGHATGANDVALTDLRRVIRDNPQKPTLLIYDKPTLLEIEKMQWQARSSRTQQMMLAGRTLVPDRQLKASAPPKMHDDLVISTSLALMGLNVVGEYEQEKPKYPEGTYGALFDHEGLLEKQDQENRAAAPGVVNINKFLH